MATYIVTYDLNRETVRPKIVDRIKQYPSWARLSESSYTINVNKTPEGVYGDLKQFIDGNDQLYIITLSQPWQGFGPKEVNDWLNTNLPHLS